MSSLRKRKANTESDGLSAAPSRKHTKTTHAAPIPKSRTRATEPQNPSTRRGASEKSNPKKAASIQVAQEKGQKRKRGAQDESEPSIEGQAIFPKEITTPASKRFRNALPPSPAETPSKRTAKLFDRLELQEPKRNAYNTPPATPEGLRIDFADILPPQLSDVVALYAALLAAINEQAALSCSDFRINVKNLLSVMTNIWNKRAVNLEDLRKLLAVRKEGSLGWALEDYGRAGLCLVQEQNTGQVGSINILDILKLKKAFENELQRQWTAWQKDHGPEAERFLAQLPLIAIFKNDSVDKASSFTSRGRDRLSSIKQAQEAALLAETEVKQADVKPATTHTRGTNLLDRVLAKQALNASRPSGPTKEQLERRSSLQRVEEIARVLEVLSAGRARASFSMQSIVQQLQQSLKSPISRIDAERCIAIMAMEVMPQYVSIIASGTVNGIVITRAGKLGLADLKKRLADIDI